MRILMLGDIFGKPGRQVISEYLNSLKEEYDINLVIANAENAAGGFGLNEKIAKELFSLGIDVLTSGNHIWDKKEIYPYIDKEPRVIRPANYPPGVPGKYVYYATVGNATVAVLSMTGRVFMGGFDCPFRKTDELLTVIKGKTKNIIIDFHAEATSEKIAFGWHVAGKVSIVAGTHTHVPTADERILLGDTAYITDIGMCGPLDGVLGVEKEAVIKKFTTQLPARFSVAKGRSQLCGIVVDIGKNGKAQKIFRISRNKNII